MARPVVSRRPLHPGRLLTALEDLLLWVCCLALVVVLVTVTFDILGRQGVGPGAPWAVEISEYVVLGIAFLAAPWLLRIKGHVSIDLLSDRVPERLNRLISAAVILTCLCACAITAYYATVYVAELFDSGTLTGAILRVPRWVTLLPMPIGLTGLALEFVRMGVELIRGHDDADATGTMEAAL